MIRVDGPRLRPAEDQASGMTFDVVMSDEFMAELERLQVRARANGLRYNVSERITGCVEVLVKQARSQLEA